MLKTWFGRKILTVSAEMQGFENKSSHTVVVKKPSSGSSTASGDGLTYSF